MLGYQWSHLVEFRPIYNPKKKKKTKQKKKKTNKNKIFVIYLFILVNLTQVMHHKYVEILLQFFRHWSGLNFDLVISIRS